MLHFKEHKNRNTGDSSEFRLCKHEQDNPFFGSKLKDTTLVSLHQD